MDPYEVRMQILGDEYLATRYRAAERRKILRGLALAALIGVALAAPISIAFSLPSGSKQAPSPVLADQLVALAHSEPEGSPALVAAGHAAMLALSPESSPATEVQAALAVIGRGRLLAQAEPWVRRALLHPEREARRAAVLWYPKVYPEFRSDPSAAAAYDAAFATLGPR